MTRTLQQTSHVALPLWANMRHLQSGETCPVAEYRGETYFIGTGLCSRGDVYRHAQGQNVFLGNCAQFGRGPTDLGRATELVLQDAEALP